MKFSKILEIDNNQDFYLGLCNHALNQLIECYDLVKKYITDQDILEFRKIDHKLKTTYSIFQLHDLSRLMTEYKINPNYKLSIEIYQNFSIAIDDIEQELNKFSKIKT